jgi:DNA repair exonuclease SbcCD ATPase subunit
MGYFPLQEGRPASTEPLVTMLLLAFATLGLAQSTASTAADSATLRDLLSEVRELRQELRTTTTAVQRAQILFHRVDAQQAAVARAFQRFEGARNKLFDLQSGRKRTENQAQQFEALLNQTDNPAFRKQYEEALTQLRAGIANSAAGEQEQQANNELEDQARLAQSKLDDLESRLDRLDKDLESPAPAR